MKALQRLFKHAAKILASKKTYITKSLTYRSKELPLPPNFDYVRYATLGLCYEEIASKKVEGNVAEVGVYRGDFAKRLNLLFPDRKIYLFDTFEGFVDSDIKVEQSRMLSLADQDFSNTSIELVKSKMPHPENCVFKKGLFPKTAEDVDDSFCFVSLDADLYTPIYEGLRFFYPRLCKGGYIFIHDFNNEQYKGSREAVVQFCKEQNLSYTPIPDSGGTAIIAK